MATGYVLTHRKIWRSNHFKKEPFTEREAFIWMVCEASWEDRETLITGELCKISRGELCHSIRHMALEWGWQKSKVHRFLCKLKSGTVIGTRLERGSVVISICNYDEYQDISKQGGTQIGTANGTILKKDIKTYSKKEKIYKKEKGFSDAFNAFWNECPKKVAKLEASKAFEKATRVTTPDAITAAMKRAAKKWLDDGTDKQYIPHPSTWLNRGCYLDEDTQPSPEPDDYYTRKLKELGANEQPNVIQLRSS